LGISQNYGGSWIGALQIYSKALTSTEVLTNFGGSTAIASSNSGLTTCSSTAKPTSALLNLNSCTRVVKSASPTISGVTSALSGNLRIFTISGSNLANLQSVQINGSTGVRARVTSSSSSTIVANIPSSSAFTNIRITTSGGMVVWTF